MGCAHGCREGYRGPSAEFLRSQAQLLLTRLLKIDERSVSVSAGTVGGGGAEAGGDGAGGRK